MTNEAMAQALYDVAGEAFLLDPTAEPPDDPATFFAVTQGAAIDLTGAYAEGFSRRLRRDTSAFVHIAATLLFQAGGGTGGQPIVVDFSAFLQNQEGWIGGIVGYTGAIIGGAGGRLNGAALAGAQWELVSTNSHSIKLVDEAGVPITTGIIANDRLSFQLSFVTVDD